MASSKRSRITRENTAVLLIDHQVGLFTGVRDLTVSDLKHNVVGLAKAARTLSLPVVTTTTARDSIGDRRFRSFEKFSATAKFWIAPALMRGMMSVS
jgi:nicotinamidase-related amidase